MNRTLSNMINQERIISTNLQKLSFDEIGYEKQNELKLEQEKHFKKFEFLKELAKATEKVRKEDYEKTR